MTVNASKAIDFPIVGSFSDDPIRKVNAQRTINLYEVSDPEGKKANYLASFSGLQQKGTFSEGPNGRNSILYRGNVYFVVGADIYRMDSGLIITRISTNLIRFNTTSGHVGIAANETQIAFTDNSKLLIWDNVASTLTDESAILPAGVTAKDITYMDGYFVIVNGATTNTNRFYISELNNTPTPWDPLNFALVNSRPTILSACAVLKRRIFLFGETNSEIWLDAGASDFPFRRDNNLLLEHGVIARSSIAQGFDRLFYLANDEDGTGGIMMVEGTLPQKISSREIDEAIQTISNPNDAVGTIYKINGDIFYQINFTSGNRTFVYYVNGNNWFELEMINKSRHIANTHVYYLGKHYIVGYNNNILYEMNPAFTNNAGENIRRTRICRVMSSPTYERIRLDRLWIDMLQGVGKPNTTDPEADPKIFLSISSDGGVTYHDYGSAEVGRSGDRLYRTIWRKLGVRRDTIVKLEMFNDVPYYILGGAAVLEVLPQ